MHILYEIIKTAQQSNDVGVLPFRAIFTAYPIVLARHGLHPDHDSIYLRFLLRLGDKRVSGQTLYEAFEALLAEFGIQVEIDPEEVTGAVASGNDSFGNDRHTFQNPTISHGSSRRSSFGTTTQAANKGNNRYNRRRSTSRASLSQLQTTTQVIPENRPSTRATTRPTERIRPTNASRHRDLSIPRDSRLTDLQSAKNILHQRQRRVSTPNHGSRETFENNVERQEAVIETHASSVFSDPENSRDSNNTTQGQGVHDIQRLHVAAPSELLYDLSETQLVRDANAFRNVSTRPIVRKAFWKWQEATHKEYTDHQAMLKKAIARDVDVLRRQAFEKWRVVYLNRMHAIETERFFNHLERKANKARNLYLLTKALTHWAECASDAMRRTFVAKRHILRMRYFNAWKEITVVNDLKIRRQRLRKSFSLWMSRVDVKLFSNNQAVTFYYNNLVKSIYWRWFWNFCERRAPEWRAARLKRQVFLCWQHRVHSKNHRDIWVNFSFEANLQRGCLLRWLEKARLLLTFSHQADSFRNHKLSAVHLLSWQLQCRHLPLARRVSSMVDWRVAYSVFSVLVSRYTVERRAEAVNRQRVIRNCWTQWNDKLRWHTLSNQIDDRVLLQALYKWVLAERSVLLQRLTEKRLLQRHLYIIAERLGHLTHRHTRNQQMIEAQRRGQYLSFAMNKWRSRMSLYHQREQLAHEYNAPLVLQNALQLWNSSIAHLRWSESRAKNAAFYFRASRTFQQWEDAIAGNRRQKRRHAYIQIRRQVKINVARRIVGHWRDQASRISEIMQSSSEISQYRLFALGTTIFDQWRERLAFLTARSHNVDKQYRITFTQRSFQRWRVELRECQERSDISDSYARLYVFKVAHDCLQTLQLKVFELASREKVATSIMTRNEKRHFRNLFHAWHVKTAKKRGLPSRLDFPLTTRSVRHAPPKMDEPTPSRNPEGWTTFEDDFEPNDWIPAPNVQTTPPPGYLNTPSKRAARARALVRLPPATPAQVKLPPTTPMTLAKGLGTSFQRRLRGQTAIDPRGVGLSRRGSELELPLGTKGGGDGMVGFEDLPDESRTGSSTLGTS